METRLIIAYSLMLVIALLVASLVAYKIYSSHDRTYRRRLRKEARDYEARRAPPRP